MAVFRRDTSERHFERFAVASLFGGVEVALRVARAVQTGTLSVNSHSSVRYWTPFGGMKQSGLGRELGPDALLSFTDVKNVFLSTVEG